MQLENLPMYNNQVFVLYYFSLIVECNQQLAIFSFKSALQTHLNEYSSAQYFNWPTRLNVMSSIHLEPWWIFSQSDAPRGRTTTASRSAVSSVHLEPSRSARVSWPATFAPAATATGPSGPGTSPPAQVLIRRRRCIAAPCEAPLTCALSDHRPVSHGVFLQRRLQTLPAVSSGELPA